MKMPLLTLLLFPISLFAQNWSLVHSDSRLNFSNSATGVVDRSIFTEQAYIQNGDSVFTMKPRSVVYFSSDPYLDPSGNLLADSIFQHAQGVYEFRYIPAHYHVSEPFIIRTLAQSGDSWEFQTGVQAQVLSVEQQSVLGTTDSVKTILLSNNDTLLLSNTFGILRLGGYRLIGLEGKNVGVQLPNNLTWYQWEPGDIYQFYSGSSDYSSSTRIWTKYIVQTHTLTPEAVKFRVRALTKTEQWYNFALSSATYSDTLADLTFPLTETALPGIYPDANGYFIDCYYQKTDTGIVRHNDSLNPPSSSGPIKTETMVEGIGLKERSFSVASAGFYYSTWETLSGYQKNGQNAHGSIEQDTFYHVFDSNSNVFEISLAPNPAVNHVIVKNNGHIPINSLQVFGATGELIYSKNGSIAFEPEIDLTSFQHDLYFVRIETDKGSITRKLLVCR